MRTERKVELLQLNGLDVQNIDGLYFVTAMVLVQGVAVLDVVPVDSIINLYRFISLALVL